MENVLVHILGFIGLKNVSQNFRATDNELSLQFKIQISKFSRVMDEQNTVTQNSRNIC